MNKEYNDQIEGRNAVLEYLESGKDINKILITKGEKHGSINKIIAIAKERKIIISELERSKLNQIAQTENNQGVIAIVPPYDYCEVEDILEVAEKIKIAGMYSRKQEQMFGKHLKTRTLVCIIKL